MKEVFVAGSNIISSLGFSARENFENVLEGKSGLKYHTDFASQPLSLIDKNRFDRYCDEYNVPGDLSFFEKLCILSIKEALIGTNIDIKSEEVLVILASTKGNIGFLEEKNERRQEIHLWESAKNIGESLETKYRPQLISSACVSGVSAQVQAIRLLKEGKYKHVIACGADLVSKFIISGFNSFKALSSNPCKPYDANRDGLSLGEGAGTIVFTTDTTINFLSGVKGIAGASSNDANHISGPSRTGDGLANAIESTLIQSKINPEFISAHGTATVYNDEMESKAIKLAGLENVPVNGLKGYFGHTLGAAGIIETIITLWAMKESKGIGTLGVEEYGVSEKVNLLSKTESIEFNSFLKIASGFGGCNAAILYSK